MAFDFKKFEDVELFLKNLDIEYRFGCEKEKKPEVCHLLGDYLDAIKNEKIEACKVYEKNCDERNFGLSCFKFGLCRLHGLDGEAKDEDKALEMFNKGCDLGPYSQDFDSGEVFTKIFAKFYENFLKVFQVLRKLKFLFLFSFCFFF